MRLFAQTENASEAQTSLLHRLSHTHVGKKLLLDLGRVSLLKLGTSAAMVAALVEGCVILALAAPWALIGVGIGIGTGFLAVGIAYAAVHHFSAQQKDGEPLTEISPETRQRRRESLEERQNFFISLRENQTKLLPYQVKEFKRLLQAALNNSAFSMYRRVYETLLEKINSGEYALTTKEGKLLLCHNAAIEEQPLIKAQSPSDNAEFEENYRELADFWKSLRDNQNELLPYQVDEFKRLLEEALKTAESISDKNGIDGITESLQKINSGKYVVTTKNCEIQFEEKVLD